MAQSAAEIRREKLRNRQKQAVETREQKGLGKKTILDWGKTDEDGKLLISEKPDSYTPKTGKDLNLLDILPWVVTQEWYRNLRTFSGLTTDLDVGEWDYKLEIPVHPNVGENNDTLICHRLAFGGQCVRCDEMFDEYGKEPYNQKVIDALKPKWKCWYNIYDYDEDANPDGDNGIWEDFSFHLFEKQVLEEADEGEETIIYSDIEMGKSIEFKGKEKQYKTKRGSFPFTEAQNIVFKDRDPYDESIVDETVSFDALVKIVSVEEFTRIHLGIDNDAPDNDQPENEPEKENPPKTNRRRSPGEQTEKDETPEWKDGDGCPNDLEFGEPDMDSDKCKACNDDVFKFCAAKEDENKKDQEMKDAVERDDKEEEKPVTRRRRVRKNK